MDYLTFQSNILVIGILVLMEVSDILKLLVSNHFCKLQDHYK